MGAFEIRDACDDEWDAFVAAHPEGHHEQLSRYARSRAAWGFRCDRIVLHEGSRIVGGLQALVRRSPVGRLAVVLRAPLAIDNNPDVLARVAEELDRLARRRSYAWVRVETFPNHAATAALERLGFRSSGEWFGRFGKRDSLLVPLSQGDNELLARMKPKGRYNVRVAQRSGVTVHAGDGSSLTEFFELYRMTSSYQGFPAFPREYFEYVLRVLGPSKRAQVFLAYHDGKPVAGIFNTIVGARSYYGWGGMSRDPEHRKLMANYLIHFTAMAWAREHGCTHYDLVGVSAFKEKLGGDQITWPLPQHKFYGLFRTLRRRITGLAWSEPRLRRVVQMVARRLYPPMPY